MSDLTSKTFWADTAERAVKTFAQSLAAALTTAALGKATGIVDVDWVGFLSLAALAAVYSVVTSVAGINIGPKGSPSLVPDAATDTPVDAGDSGQS